MTCHILRQNSSVSSRVKREQKVLPPIGPSPQTRVWPSLVSRGGAGSAGTASWYSGQWLAIANHRHCSYSYIKCNVNGRNTVLSLTLHEHVPHLCSYTKHLLSVATSAPPCFKSNVLVGTYLYLSIILSAWPLLPLGSSLHNTLVVPAGGQEWSGLLVSASPRWRWPGVPRT